MKKIIASLFVLSILFFGCEKDITTEDISTITNFVTFELEGESQMTVAKGDTYEEPGYTAFEGEEDVTAQVQIDGSVDTDTPGVYTLTYSAENQDGFSAGTSRTVVVYDPAAPAIDLSGTYAGQREGSSGGPVTITTVAPGIFFVSDMFGGYYDVVAGYGSAYRLRSYIMINADNTIVGLKTDSPWGPWDIRNGVYNPTSETISHRVFLVPSNFGYNVTLTKQQ